MKKYLICDCGNKIIFDQEITHNGKERHVCLNCRNMYLYNWAVDDLFYKKFFPEKNSYELYGYNKYMEKSNKKLLEVEQNDK